MKTWCDVVKILLKMIVLEQSLKINQQTDQSGSKIKPKRRPTSFHEIEAFKKKIYVGAYHYPVSIERLECLIFEKTSESLSVRKKGPICFFFFLIDQNIFMCQIWRESGNLSETYPTKLSFFVDSTWNGKFFVSVIPTAFQNSSLGRINNLGFYIFRMHAWPNI